MPLFILMGGEVVIAIVGSRMALWVWRGWRALKVNEVISPQPPPAERRVPAAAVIPLPLADAVSRDDSESMAA